jgi:hypothetical protein
MAPATAETWYVRSYESLVGIAESRYSLPVVPQMFALRGEFQYS